MNETRKRNGSSENGVGESGDVIMRQADVKQVRALDLRAAREAVKDVVKEELKGEIVSAELLNFRMKCR